MSTAQREELLRSMYGAFNRRDIDTVVAAMTADVDWPNGWEGGRVVGHDDVRNYWERQWAAIDPTVEPTALTERAEDEIEVTVHQVVRDKTGTLLSDSQVCHVYAFRGDLVERMDIEERAPASVPVDHRSASGRPGGDGASGVG